MRVIKSNEKDHTVGETEGRFPHLLLGSQYLSHMPDKSLTKKQIFALASLLWPQCTHHQLKISVWTLTSDQEKHSN
jgi:hypothetical protein